MLDIGIHDYTDSDSFGRAVLRDPLLVGSRKGRVSP